MIKKMLIICALLLCASSVEANDNIQTVVAYGKHGRDYIKTAKTCINGRMFAIAYTGIGYSNLRGISMVQIFDYKTAPVPCTGGQ